LKHFLRCSIYTEHTDCFCWSLNQGVSVDICCRMLIPDIDIVNFSVIFMWFYGFCPVSAKQSSEIYCGGR